MSKKVFLPVLLLLAALLQMMMCVGAAAKEYYYDNEWHPYSGKEFRLSVNGAILEASMPPIVFEGYSVVPAREVFEALGAKVVWDGAARTVTVTYGAKRIFLTINSVRASVDGKTMIMPIAAKIINDKTMIPVRFVGEQLGWRIDFDEKTNTVIVENQTGGEKEHSVTSVKWEKNKANTAGFLTVTTDADKAEYSVFTMENPSRIVLDVKNMHNKTGRESISVGERNVEKIRIGQHEDTTRFVIDLTETSSYTEGSDGASIVITVALKQPQEIAEPQPAGTATPSPTVKPSNPANSETPESETPEPPVHKLERYVTIDTGHGGGDPGAVYKNEDGELVAQEKEINLAVALKVQEKLEAAGVRVHMIRTTDTYVDFQKVGSIANEMQTTLFVSVHTNSAVPEEVSGIETWGFLSGGSEYNGMTSAKLSKNVLDELIAATGAKNRGVKDGKNLAVIRTTQMPATLVEIGFITNAEDRDKMLSDSYRDTLAGAIAKGILKSLDEMGL